MTVPRPFLSLLLLALAAGFGPRALSQRSNDSGAALPTLNVVYIGDSITQGVHLDDPSTQSPPAVCTRLLGQTPAARRVFGSNQGHSGHTTADFLPSTAADFPAAERAATELQTAHPGLLVFSVMLGTNDSANSGPNGSPVAPEQYRLNLLLIFTRLLHDFPAAIIVVHRPTWYTPNTHNRSDYGARGLNRLKSYFPEIDAVVRSIGKTDPHHVYRGDTDAFAFFAKNYRAQLTPEQGVDGVFYLHPNAAGARRLAAFWSRATENALSR